MTVPADRAPTAPGHAVPVLRIAAGRPDDTQIAAVVTVLTGLLGDGTMPPPRRSGSGWADRSRMLREPLDPRAGWRGSAAPR